MTYTKPIDITYTQMAIWIDENVYKESLNEELLYQYLYHLSAMLAHEGKYFDSLLTYDEFALYSASKLYMRLTDKRQFSGDLKQIKSILNYLKAVIYPYKVDFESEFGTPSIEGTKCFYTNVDLTDQIEDDISIFDSIEFSHSLDNISAIVKKYLNTIPRKKNSAEWYNIYISCMLTLLDSITLCKEELDQWKEDHIDARKLTRISRIINEKEPILFHLDRMYTAYIKVLVNEIKHVIAKELTIESRSFVSAEASMKSLLANIMEEAYGTDNE